MLHRGMPAQKSATRHRSSSQAMSSRRSSQKKPSMYSSRTRQADASQQHASMETGTVLAKTATRPSAKAT